MIIKASQRSGARNLANHLANTQDNDHVTLHDIRGLAGQSLHAALLEIDAVSKGTHCQQPLFSVSFNPPPDAEVSENQFDRAFAKLEETLGLTDQPRVVVYHEKEGRRHCHVVWSRIDVDNMRAINMAHFKRKCTAVSRQLYLEHGWDMPKGLQNKAERDPFQLNTGEWQRLKRQAIDPRELKALIQNAWQSSDNAKSLKTALEHTGLFLAKGDKRGFVVVDHTEKVYSLSRHGGLKTKELKARLGNPEDLPSIAEAIKHIRSIYTKDALAMIRSLKNQHKAQLLPLERKKAEMVEKQRAERKELQQAHQEQRKDTIKAIRSRFRQGVMGFFDMVSGRNKRLRLVGTKQTEKLKQKQSDVRQIMLSRQQSERRSFQVQIVELKQRQLEDRIRAVRDINRLRQRNNSNHQVRESRNVQSNQHKESRNTRRQKRDLS